MLRPHKPNPHLVQPAYFFRVDKLECYYQTESNSNIVKYGETIKDSKLSGLRKVFREKGGQICGLMFWSTSDGDMEWLDYTVRLKSFSERESEISCGKAKLKLDWIGSRYMPQIESGASDFIVELDIDSIGTMVCKRIGVDEETAFKIILYTGEVKKRWYQDQVWNRYYNLIFPLMLVGPSAQTLIRFMLFFRQQMTSIGKTESVHGQVSIEEMSILIHTDEAPNQSFITYSIPYI